MKPAAIAAFILGLIIGGHPAYSQVIDVPEAGSETPTRTFYWPAQNPRALLLLIPGGDGHINLSPTQRDVRAEFYLILKELSLGSEADGVFDVVLFSNPDPIDKTSKGYPSGRGSPAHLSRIRDVIGFYREKTRKPVWLMGHSNGAVSVTEYLRYQAKRGELSQIAGLIVSSARSNTYFDTAPLSLPILFMHHRRDSCEMAQPGASLNNFKKVAAINAAHTSFIYVETGSPEAKPVCDSGFHMYHDAAAEVAATLRTFMMSYTP
jgi:pimeloyl-ACP methyl ester carboxylesterase